MPAREEGDAAGEQPTLTIEVFFDFVCPWCLIGKRNLDEAIKRLTGLRPDVSVDVLWRSHQLLPATPDEGMPYEAFYRARLGGPEAVAMRRAQVRRAGEAAGIAFAFERIELLPNTARAHRLVAYADRHGTRAQCATVVERVFTEYFLAGGNIGDTALLARLGRECGLEGPGLLDHLADSPDRANGGDHAPSALYGVSGVPCFVFNGARTLSGAYAPDVLLDTMLQRVQG